MSVDEKIELLDRLIDAGIDPDRMMSGTGCSALSDTVELTRRAVDSGCAGCLMLPPFYYKDVSDDGLFASYAEVIERVGNDKLRIYLYHIPPIAQVGLSIDLIERLVTTYPNTVVGIKDSSGDWENTRAILDLGLDDFRVFAGSEKFLLRNMQQGGAGCISATANVNPAAIDRLFSAWQSDEATALQQELDAVRDVVETYPMIPAVKAIVAACSNDADWTVVRPPLIALSDEQRKRLMKALEQLDFEMPGLTGRKI
jgi:4-hydroxy-tetrahydrodipicolinate synthase